MGNFLDNQKFATQETCEYYVNKNPWNLEDVPDHFKTQEMCDKTIEKVSGKQKNNIIN